MAFKTNVSALKNPVWTRPRQECTNETAEFSAAKFSKAKSVIVIACTAAFLGEDFCFRSRLLKSRASSAGVGVVTG